MLPEDYPENHEVVDGCHWGEKLCPKAFLGEIPSRVYLLFSFEYDDKRQKAMNA